MGLPVGAEKTSANRDRRRGLHETIRIKNWQFKRLILFVIETPNREYVRLCSTVAFEQIFTNTQPSQMLGKRQILKQTVQTIRCHKGSVFGQIAAQQLKDFLRDFSVNALTARSYRPTACGENERAGRWTSFDKSTRKRL